MTANIRKLVIQVDETRQGNGAGRRPTRRAVAIAVIEKPSRAASARTSTSSSPSAKNSARCSASAAALRHRAWPGAELRQAAIVGERGELEHAAAILHPAGAPPRVAVEKVALVPGQEAVNASALPSTLLGDRRVSCAAISTPKPACSDMRLGANEIVVAVAVTDSGRLPPRIGDRRPARSRAKTVSADPSSRHHHRTRVSV